MARKEGIRKTGDRPPHGFLGFRACQLLRGDGSDQVLDVPIMTSCTSRLDAYAILQVFPCYFFY